MFLRGRMKVVRPERWAASSLSLTPPMGSTRPRRVTSPVMATSRRTRRPEATLTIAVTMVTPADGPSLGMAPAGTWTWSAWVSKKSRGAPYSTAWTRAQESAARADSSMTLPSWPVSERSGGASTASASTVTMSPPTSLTTTPVTAPTSSSSWASP